MTSRAASSATLWARGGRRGVRFGERGPGSVVVRCPRCPILCASGAVLGLTGLTGLGRGSEWCLGLAAVWVCLRVRCCSALGFVGRPMTRCEHPMHRNTVHLKSGIVVGFSGQPRSLVCPVLFACLACGMMGYDVG